MSHQKWMNKMVAIRSCFYLAFPDQSFYSLAVVTTSASGSSLLTFPAILFFFLFFPCSSRKTGAFFGFPHSMFFFSSILSPAFRSSGSSCDLFAQCRLLLPIVVCGCWFVCGCGFERERERENVEQVELPADKERASGCARLAERCPSPV